MWCPEVSRQSATVRVRTEVKNYGSSSRTVTLKSEIMNAEGTVLKTVEDALPIAGGVLDTFDQTTDPLADPRVWDGVADPYLHKVRSSVMVGGEVVDQVTTSFGIYRIEWPKSPGSTVNHFKLNGRQVFLNGTCEYQHLLGADHAFSEEQVKARVEMIRAAGFNAMRDAHYPHTLSYYDYLDRTGIVNWPQMGSRTTFTTDEFLENYKRLTARWVKERRNHPCIVLWGVQNESDMTRAMHRQLVGTINQMDPLAKQQRLAVVCHSTVPGTDWEIPQDWSGVYGGNFNQYDPVLDNESGTMAGEYGSWIVLGSHVDKTYNGSEGDKTETYACALYEAKIRRGEMLRDNFCGHFQWIFSTHSNPGRPIAADRRQKEGWDGQILAPVNNKGLFTCWGQPYDAYYVFRSNYAPGNTDPMVYIVSHTWPDRWDAAGTKSRIVVYSNCDQVTLYNDYKASSLGSKTRRGIGTHLQWDDVNIEYNVLYAEGTVGGSVVAADIVVLDNLPAAPNLDAFDPDPPNVLAVESGGVLHRVNCGGGEYTDGNGNTWKADKKFASGKDYGHRSWGDVFNYQHAGGNSITFDPIRGTADDQLFRTFRYGRHHLTYRFQVPAAATYGVEFYCIEPWYGAGAGEGGRGCAGWRMFDIAVEGKTVVNDLDVWKLAGHDRALRIPINAAVNDGVLDITFPEVKAGQAVVSAIAVMNGPLSSRPGPARAWQVVRPRISAERGILAVSLDTRGGHTVELLDVSGRLVARRAGRGVRRYEFREPMMRSALYFVRVRAGDRVFTTRRITLR